MPKSKKTRKLAQFKKINPAKLGFLAALLAAIGSLVVFSTYAATPKAYSTIVSSLSAGTLYACQSAGRINLKSVSTTGQYLSTAFSKTEFGGDTVKTSRITVGKTSYSSLKIAGTYFGGAIFAPGTGGEPQADILVSAINNCDGTTKNKYATTLSTFFPGTVYACKSPSTIYLKAVSTVGQYLTTTESDVQYGDNSAATLQIPVNATTYAHRLIEGNYTYIGGAIFAPNTGGTPQADVAISSITNCL